MIPFKSHLSRRNFLKALTVGVGGGVLIGSGLSQFKWFEKVEEVSRGESVLGTWISITVHHPDREIASKAIDDAFEAIRKVDRVMSLHRKDSDLSRVNAKAGSEMVVVDPSFLEILRFAHQTFKISGGVYDITCLPLMRLYGFYQERPNLFPSDALIQDTLFKVDQRHISVEALTGRVGLIRKGMGIDLGSIGKGYAVDRAGEALKKAGIQNALIDAGGNILAMGSSGKKKNFEEGWRVAIRNPYDHGKKPYFETLTLKDKAVATSGNYEQNFCVGDKRVGHLMDALTGKPSDPQLSATVIAETATMADAFSTTAFLLTPSRVAPLREVTEAIYFHNYDEVDFQPSC